MNATKTDRITVLVGGGGFHNASPTELSLPAERVFDEARIAATFAHPELHNSQEVLLTWTEYGQVARDACGMRDCCCGSEICATLMHPADYVLFGIADIGDAFLVPAEIQ